MTTTAFSFTGAFETWVVPTGITTITVDAYGAAGGTGNDVAQAGGLGARVVCDVAVTPGETLRVYVGGVGTKSQLSANAGGGFNGGGTGTGSGGFHGGGGGGGGSDIRRSPFGLADRLASAGGGGGGGFHSVGGGGGFSSGIAGAGANGGGGGTQSAGGAGGGGSISGFAGALGQGGNAGVGGFAGGGGGGLYGGGGGGGTSGARHAGGGGSTQTTGVNSTTTNATRSGNGALDITYAQDLGAVFPIAAGFTIAPTTNLPRWSEPRRDHLWVRNLSGQQIGVIR